MYEVEIKIELSKEEKNSLSTRLEEKGFLFQKTTKQRDFYIEAQDSPYRGQGGKYDFKRYRAEEGVFIFTAKSWEMSDKGLARKQDEHEVSQEVFEKELAKFPNALSLEKLRDWFSGVYLGESINFTVDTVKFSHSPSERYFVEAEILVDDKNKVSETKILLNRFLQELLGKEEVIESPGMFGMLFERK